MKRARLLALAGVSLFALDPAYGQSNPGFYFDFVPTAAQWNSYFAGKADYPGIINNPNTWIGTQTFTNLTVSGSLTTIPFLTTPTAISGLPSCDTNSVGMRAVINNAIASPTYHQSVSGTGGAVWPVFCALSGWVYD